MSSKGFEPPLALCLCYCLLNPTSNPVELCWFSRAVVALRTKEDVNAGDNGCVNFVDVFPEWLTNVETVFYTIVAAKKWWLKPNCFG